MDESLLYGLLDLGVFGKWRDKLEEAESDTWYFTSVQETYAALDKALSEQEKNLLELYALAFENKMDYLHYNLNSKVLSLGINIGMQLSKTFEEFENM